MIKMKKAGRRDVSDGEKIKQMMGKCKYQLHKGEHQIFYELETTETVAHAHFHLAKMQKLIQPPDQAERKGAADCEAGLHQDTRLTRLTVITITQMRRR